MREQKKENRQVRSKAVREGRSKRTLFRRTVFLTVVCGVGLFIPLFLRLWNIAIVHHEEYQKQATRQQTLDLSVTASRGNIYDCNGNVMAMSATVYSLILSPKDLIQDKVPKKEFMKDGELDTQAWEAAVRAQQNKLTEDLLQLLPELDRERVQRQVEATKYSYREIETKLEEEQVAAIREYIVANKTSHYLYLISGTKRYYPYAGLAAQALGFVNDEGGAYGIEAAYDDVLKGTAGRVVTSRTGAGTQMYNSYSEFIDAIDGYDLTLSIDATIQSYAEKTLARGIEAYDVQHGAFCIALNPKTGAILAIASSPDFDPNNYSIITDDLLNEKMTQSIPELYQKLQANNPENLTQAQLMEKAQAQAYSDAINTQWRSKAIDSRYEPGSTFKALVLSAALEEGVVSESDTFHCSGSITVAGYPKPIACSKRTGHGTQTLAQAVENSCNPAFVQIGQRLGKERFYDYFEAFGMKENTGIDLPGEASLSGAVWSREAMSNVDLAVASFGQRFEITPLQLITGFAATINGGNLVKPYVMQSIKTKDGELVKNTEPTVVRQVISQQTSDKVRSILEGVVDGGTGKNAYMAGYRIGGKTGTSEIKKQAGDVIVSFVGFAPANDPEVLVLLAYDRPKRQSAGSSFSTTGVYISGGNMAAKQAGLLIAEICDYMGIEKQLTEEESAAVDVITPRVIGVSVDEAAQLLEKKNLKYRTVGEGSVVTEQVPNAGSSIPGGSSVVLYLGDAQHEQMGTVPEVIGLSYDAARKKLEDAGFFMRAGGVATYYGNSTTVSSQSLSGGEQAAIGTVIDIEFFNQVEDGLAGIG